MKWFRWHRGTCTVPKMGSISRQVNAPRERVIAVWAMVLESVSDDEGSIGIDADGIADCLNVDTTEIDAILDAFENKEMLGNGRVSKWSERQYVTSTDRVKAFRERQRNTNETPCNVSETPQIQTQIQKKEKSNKKEKTVFEEFWLAYPKKVSKGAAVKAFDKAMKTTDLKTLLAGIARSRWKDPEFIPHPATWLNQERWLDEPDVPPPQADNFGVTSKRETGMSLQTKADMWIKGVRMGAVHTDEWKRAVVKAEILTEAQLA